MSNLGYESAGDHEAWLARLDEEALEPGLPIIDAHHHLWFRPRGSYLFPELLADLDCGQNVVATVFAECHSMYRADGPEALRPVGETEFVAGVAAMSGSGNYGPSSVCKVLFGAVDVELGSGIEPVIDAHMRAAGGRFRGIRISCGWHESDKIRNVASRPGMLRDPAVRDAIGVLDAKGLSLDVWLYHPQLDELADLADTFPGLTIILDHVGSPILGGPYRERRAEVFADWREKIDDVAQRQNVVMKLGALPIRFPGDDVDRSLPPGSREVADAWRPWIEACIEAFGPDRCMFESNFPVQKNWCSYGIVWNAFKRIAQGASADAKADLFAGTARRAYRITE